MMLLTMTWRMLSSFLDGGVLSPVQKYVGCCRRTSGTAATTVPEWLLWVAALGPAEDAVEVRATHRARGLGHPGALLVDAHLAGGLPLRLTFHAVELAAVRLRHDFSLLDVRPHTGYSCGTSRCAIDHLLQVF